MTNGNSDYLNSRLFFAIAHRLSYFRNSVYGNNDNFSQQIRKYLLLYTSTASNFQSGKGTINEESIRIYNRSYIS